RIFRLSWFGHQSRLPPPWVGCGRRATGQPTASSFISPMGWPSRLSGIGGILPGLGRWGGDSGTECGRTGGAQAPEDDFGLVDREATVVGGGKTGRLTHGRGDVGDQTT